MGEAQEQPADPPNPGLPTWCESPCRSKVGFGLGPQDEVDAGVTGLGSGDVLNSLPSACSTRDEGR